MSLVPPTSIEEIRQGIVDNILVALLDIMPTLLSLCGVPVPISCDGLLIIGAKKRQTLYCESMDASSASLVVTNRHYEQPWHPAGNRIQLLVGCPFLSLLHRVTSNLGN